MGHSRVGFFGKLPGYGDFVERNFPPALRQVWDEWLQRGLAESQRTLGDTWLDTYLTSPIWRFFLHEGVAGAASYTGILMPSVDRVGRYFPLTVAVELGNDVLAMRLASAGAPWFEAVERQCMDVLHHVHVSVEQFTEGLAQTEGLLASFNFDDRSAALLSSATQWRFALRSAKQVASALEAPLSLAVQNALRPLTMWWTDGSERLSPSALLVQSMPRPRAFAAMLAGGWDDGQWAGDIVDFATETLAGQQALAPPLQLEIATAVHTDTGPRPMNQDRFASNADTRIWAVADGMGGHARGEVASQMVVDALNDLPPTATLNTALEDMSTALTRVNSDLYRVALSADPDDTGQRCGSTVVALAIRGPYWGAVWAGDSRAYLLRDGLLTLLTTDHTSANELASAAGLSPAEIVTSNTGEITRAVGGAEQLELDRVSDLVASGDRFLLCSDGLFGAIDDAAIAGCLLQQPASAAVKSLVDAALAAGTGDNVTALVIDVLPSGEAEVA